MTYHVYGTVVASKYLGTVEADSEEEAKEKGQELPAMYVSVCHQCAREVEDPEISDVTVSLAK